jgi:NADH:ubiquinone oxidoreductase subunit 5 (subunit L)/multisubunit Na+/H+ antiporter MnhA subunit
MTTALSGHRGGSAVVGRVLHPRRLRRARTAFAVPLLRFIQSGALEANWALRIDTLTVVMLVVVNTVSALVHIYSIGYMHHDPHRPRFFAYLSLFTFAMLMLVTSDNLIQMFFGWEGVGLASYLLIGFWYKKAIASAAAIKAFVVNRVGDFGFLLGIFGLFALTGSVNFDAVFANVAAPDSCRRCGRKHRHGAELRGLCTEQSGCPDGRLRCCLFMGAMGKSAQVPAAHLAAGRHGRPDAGLRAHPRGDDGDRRRVHGGAPVAGVRAGGHGADGGDPDRRHSRRSSPPRSAWSRTTSSA